MPMPGPVEDYQRVFDANMWAIAKKSNRETFEPKVKIDHELVFQYQNPNISKITKDYDIYTCNKNSSFLLSLEVEPNCMLMFTTNGKHPLLADPKDINTAKKSF